MKSLTDEKVSLQLPSPLHRHHFFHVTLYIGYDGEWWEIARFLINLLLELEDTCTF